jgi:hypothetical protein
MTVANRAAGRRDSINDLTWVEPFFTRQSEIVLAIPPVRIHFVLRAAAMCNEAVRLRRLSMNCRPT